MHDPWTWTVVWGWPEGVKGGWVDGNKGEKLIQL